MGGGGFPEYFSINAISVICSASRSWIPQVAPLLCLQAVFRLSGEPVGVHTRKTPPPSPSLWPITATLTDYCN